MLKRTRLSLIYVASYLSLAGLGCLLAPQFAMHAFFSNGHYDNTFIRVAGACLIVLGIFVIQIVRYRLEILYKTVIMVRIFLLAIWAILYLITRDPLFLAFLAIVGFGVALSVSAFLLDQKAYKKHSL